MHVGVKNTMPSKLLIDLATGFVVQKLFAAKRVTICDHQLDLRGQQLTSALENDTIPLEHSP